MTNDSPATPGRRGRVTDQNLRNLHQAYQEFMQTHPWQELNDRNLLLFEDPDPALQACCVVMGHWGIERGLAAYTGALATDNFIRIILGADGRQAQQARSIAATTGHSSLVSSDERQRMHRLGIRYHGKHNHPIWFSKDPGQHGTRRIDDQEAASLADWLGAATDAALRIRAGTLTTTTMDLAATDDRTFHPIKCLRLPDGSWQHTPFTMTRTG